MDKPEYLVQITGFAEPSDEPSARRIVLEKRKRRKDRRKLQTYIADDLRNGIADRRRPPVQEQNCASSEIEDRRQTHTYVADDQRSGIADRRRSKRFLLPLRRVVVYCPQ
jgi:hypothetical protein